MNDILEHRGTPHEGMIPHSGRNPWGSGENPYQRSQDFLARVNDAEKKVGKNQVEVSKELGISTTELRQMKSLAKNEIKQNNIARAVYLKKKGYSNNKIKEMMGLKNESNVRALLKDYEKNKEDTTKKTADILEKELKKKKYIDVGAGAEIEIGVTENKLNTALRLLKDKGYTVQTIRVEQAGNPGNYTTVKVLAKEGTTVGELLQNKDKIKALGDYYSTDDGKTFGKIQPPQSISSDRIKINYADTGDGASKDGVIEIRKGVDDLNLGNSQYAQVRIAVDGTHYLKGMAMYSDNIPDGFDVVFNTNKSSNVKKMDVLKPLSDDPDNPFGALIKEKGQSTYIGKDGKEHLSAINKLKEEGDWTKWDKTIASQFLSKQSVPLARQQLSISLKEKKAELAEINACTNPVIKKHLLEAFADDCDSSSVHLKAAALPRQAWKVILPIPSLKSNEIYAPGYRNGEQVALVRYPHGGTFEIPQVTVNNNNKAAKSVMKNAQDAVGINSSVAERLSGADFDGDTVLVIPTSNSKITSTSPLKGLKDFNPSESYPGYKGMKVISEAGKQRQMGIISNLITDMTLQGATEDELARAVRHSMVIIDAKKHELNYKKSAVDNGISALHKKYQTHGASTLISRAKSPYNVPHRKTYYKIDKDTGEKIYRYTGETYKDKDGKIVKRTTESTKMAEAKDARELSSGTRMEELYASYANNLKALANQARKEYVNMKNVPYSPSAAKTYENEVKTLDSKLNNALKNAPRERQAQLIANSIYEKKLKQFPELKDKSHKDDRTKIKNQALAVARAETGAISRKNRNIDITDREWEAIQSHAITNNKLEKIIANTSLDDLKKRATPRATTVSSSKESMIKALVARGYTQSEVADRVGVSASTVYNVMNG